MTRRWVFGLVVSSIAAMALAACGSSRRMHYKMIVELDTPEGLKSGYAVREITYSEPSSLPSIVESRPQWRVRGEAVAVGLPGGRTLFALLISGGGNVNYAGRDVWSLFHQLGKDTPGGVIELWPNVPKVRKPIIYNPLPMLVTFADVHDPKSVVRVDPSDPAAVFGPGVRLRRITVEATDDAVTSGIDKRLTWLPAQRGGLDFTGRRHAKNPEKDATELAFTEGMK